METFVSMILAGSAGLVAVLVIGKLLSDKPTLEAVPLDARQRAKRRRLKGAAAASTLAVAAAGLVTWWYWDDWVVAPRVRAGVMASMRDPESTRIRNEQIYPTHVCGEINSRNGYGAYVGYVRFISTEKAYTTEGDGRMSFDSERASAQEILEELEWRNAKLDKSIAALRFARENDLPSPGRTGKPTEEEVNARRFNRLWAKHCKTEAERKEVV